MMASENKASNINFQKTNSKKNHIVMIRKDWGFCDQILQATVILDKMLKNFTFTFFNFNSSFFLK